MASFIVSLFGINDIYVCFKIFKYIWYCQAQSYVLFSFDGPTVNCCPLQCLGLLVPLGIREKRGIFHFLGGSARVINLGHYNFFHSQGEWSPLWDSLGEKPVSRQTLRVLWPTIIRVASVIAHPRVVFFGFSMVKIHFFQNELKKNAENYFIF